MAVGAGAIRAAQAFVEILADDSKARAVLKQFQARMNSWATSMNQVGRAMMLPSIGVGLAMGKTTKVFADFEKEISRLKARLEDGDKGLAALEKRAISLGKTTVFSAREVASAMTELAQAGDDSAAILTKIGSVLDFAAAAEIGMAEAAIFGTTALKTFKLEASQMGHMMDIITKGANISETSVAEMAEAFSYAAPSFAQVGASVQDLSASLSLLAHAGQRGDRAGTALRGIFQAIADPSDRGGEALRNLVGNIKDARGEFIGMEAFVTRMQRSLSGAGGIEKMSQLGKIFDNRMVTAIQTLVEAGPGTFAAEWNAVNDSLGQNAKMARVQMDNLTGEFRRLRGALEAFQITLTKAVVEPLRGFTVGIRMVIGVMDEWAKRNPEMVRVLAALGVAMVVIGPALIAASVAMKLFVFAMNPVFAGMTAMHWIITKTVPLFGVLRGAALMLATVIGGKLVSAFRLLAVVMATSVTVAARIALVALARLYIGAHILLAKGTVALIKPVLMGAIAAVSALVPVVISAFTALIAPVGIFNAALIGIAVALAAIGVAIVYASGAWGRAVATMKTAWSNFTGSAVRAWGVVVDSIRAGRFDLAFKAACILAKIAWLEMVDFLMTNWEEFRDFTIEVIDEVVTSMAIGVARIQDAWNGFFKWFEGQNERFNVPAKPGEAPGRGGGGRLGGAGGQAAAGAGFGGGVAGMAGNALAAAVFGRIAGGDGAAMGDRPADAGRAVRFAAMRERASGIQDRRNDRRLRNRPKWMNAIANRRPGVGIVNPVRSDLRDMAPWGMEPWRKPPVEGPGGEKVVLGEGGGGVRQENVWPGPLGGAQRAVEAAEANLERVKNRRSKVLERMESGRAKQEDVDRWDRNVEKAESRVEAQKNRFAEIAKKTLMLGPGLTDEQKKALGIPVGEQDTQNPPALLAANEAVQQAREKRDAAGTVEEQVIADKELRHAERVQAREQRKFEFQKRREALQKELSLSKKEAEAALKGGLVGGGSPRMGGMFGDMMAGAKASVQGTFSAVAASGLGAGNNQLSRIAMYSEQTAKNTKEIKDKEGVFS